MTILLDRGIERLVFDQPEPSCVLYLPGLPGGSNKVYDRSPYGNIGTIVGATWVRLPSGLWCLSFDGTDDYVSLGGNPASLQITGNLTITAWINLTQNAVKIISKDGTAGRSYYFSTAVSKIALAIFRSNTEYRTIGTTDLLNLGWKHVVGVNDGTNLKVYVDDVEENSEAKGGTIDNDPVDIEIGKSQWGAGGEWFGGKIALPRIYNRALSAFEIQNHFNREKHLFGVW